MSDKRANQGKWIDLKDCQLLCNGEYLKRSYIKLRACRRWISLNSGYGGTLVKLSCRSRYVSWYMWYFSAINKRVLQRVIQRNLYQGCSSLGSDGIIQVICTWMFHIDYSTSKFICTFAPVTIQIDVFVYSVPRKILVYASGLNSQLYCLCVQGRSLSKFLNVTVGPDCCILPSLHVSLLGKKYLSATNIFLILKRSVGFHINALLWGSYFHLEQIFSIPVAETQSPCSFLELCTPMNCYSFFYPGYIIKGQNWQLCARSQLLSHSFGKVYENCLEKSSELDIHKFWVFRTT